MKAFVIAAMCCVSVQAFAPVPKGSFGVKAAPQAQSSSSTLMMAKSKSLPFLDQPAALDGTMPGDVGFDPLGLTENINLPYGMCRCLSMFVASNVCANFYKYKNLSWYGLLRPCFLLSPVRLERVRASIAVPHLSHPGSPRGKLD